MDYQRDLADAGHFPFTRGIHETMYRGRLWTIRQYAGFASAEQTNARFKYLLQQGETGLSVAFDLPTQLGLESDDPLACGEVGRVGVPIDTLEDMERLFEGIPLEKTSVSFTVNATAPMIVAMYVALAEKRGVDPTILRGTVQNDILKEFAARGTWVFPPAPSLRLAVDIIEYCTSTMPAFYPISVCGYHFREAGSTAVQELGLALSNARVYVASALERGVDIDNLGPRLSFFMSVTADIFEEVAKFRAARRIWARTMRDQYHAKNPSSWLFRAGASCGGSTLTAQQPQNNIVRVAYEALAAVLGGVQSLFTCAWDEPFSLPSEESALTALRTQQILAFETGIRKVVDPLGGSYFLENLTNRFEHDTKSLMSSLEDAGGSVFLIETGRIQQMIADNARLIQQSMEAGDRPVVGVSLYGSPEHPASPSFSAHAVQDEARQIDRLAKVKQHRDTAAVAMSLQELHEAAQGCANLVPPLIRAAKRLVTIGEMTSVLRSEFGDFKEPLVF
jgi:methylmalonyl-CoA mutase N-terminal domain/subunit